MTDILDLWYHLAERTIKNMELVCMRRNCKICEYFYSIGVDLYNNKQQQTIDL